MAGLGAYASYNGVDFDHVRYKERWRPVFEGGVLMHYVHEFEIQSQVQAANYSAWNTAKSNIITALTEPGKTLTITEPSPQQFISFGASDCLGDGPYVEGPDFDDMVGWSFVVRFVVKGDVEPAGGSGTPVDTYEDDYSYDKQGRRTYRRTGTQRVSSAYADEAAAFEAVDPGVDSSTWEFDGKSGKLDEDGKRFDYTFQYVEFYEDLPPAFVDLDYSIRTDHQGRQKTLVFSAEAGIDFDDGDVESMGQNLENFGRQKIKEGASLAVITGVSVTPKKRAGRVSVTINALIPASGNLIEWTEATTRSKKDDFIILKKLGGGGWRKIKMGDPDKEVRITGRKVGITKYPDVPSPTCDDDSITHHLPEEGPDGKYYYAVDYSFVAYSCDGPSLGSGGGGGGNGPWLTSGLISGGSGGLAGSRSSMGTSNLISGAAGRLAGLK